MGKRILDMANQSKLLNPHTGDILAQIALEGEQIQTDILLSTDGILQGFKIISATKSLREAWYKQEPLLMRTGRVQQLVKIATYPTDGESQGHLDLLQGIKEYYMPQAQHKSNQKIRRGLNFLQTIIGA